MAQSAEFSIFKCLRSCKNHLYQNVQIQILLQTFPVCVPNTVDNNVMYLPCAESYHPKLRNKFSAIN